MEVNSLKTFPVFRDGILLIFLTMKIGNSVWKRPPCPTQQCILKSLWRPHNLHQPALNQSKEELCALIWKHNLWTNSLTLVLTTKLPSQYPSIWKSWGYHQWTQYYVLFLLLETIKAKSTNYLWIVMVCCYFNSFYINGLFSNFV